MTDLRAWWANFLRWIYVSEPEPQVVNSPKWGIIRAHQLDNPLNGTPAVEQIQDRPVVGGKGADIPVSAATEGYIRLINNEKGAWYAIETVGSMWINKAGDPKMAVSISNMRNIVSWEREENKCADLRCFADDEDWSRFVRGGVATVTFETRPDVFFKAQAIYDDGHFSKVNNGIDCYIPLMCRHSHNGTGKLYLALSHIEPFPSLPVTVTPKTSLNVRETFDIASPAVASLFKGQTTKIYEYRPRGRSVWGRTKNGWIALRYEGLELTSWHLETPSVV